MSNVLRLAAWFVGAWLLSAMIDLVRGGYTGNEPWLVIGSVSATLFGDVIGSVATARAKASSKDPE
jgi:hypothetical protein